MKRFLLIPSCALLAFGMLTSCQKEDKTAQQLAEELTAELQKVTDYKTAEAVAPRVEALNKRFQNASVRVFSADANALAGSEANAYSDVVCRLVRELGRVQAGKPVAAADGEVDDNNLIRAVGVGAGVASSAPTKEQYTKGQLYTFNSESESNNTPPALPEYYGSQKLAAALSYVASTDDNGAFKFASEEDVPAIPDAVDVEAEPAPAVDPMPADDAVEPAEADEESAEVEETVDADAEVETEEPVADDEAVVEETVTEEEPADEEVTDDAAAEEEPAAEEEAAEEEVTDDAAAEEEDLGDDMDMDIEL